MNPILAQIESVPSDALKNFALIVGGLLAAAYYFKEIFFRKPAEITPQPLAVTGTPPGNDVLSRDVKSLNHRVKALEDWRGALLDKLEDDKREILAAGENRIERIGVHIDSVRRELDEKIDNVPDRVIATLKNTGAI